MATKVMYSGKDAISLSKVEETIPALEEAEYYDDIHDTTDFTDTVYYGLENTTKLGFGSHVYTVEELEAQDKYLKELDTHDLNIIEQVWTSFTNKRDYKYNR